MKIKTNPSQFFEDNQAAIKASYNPECIKNLKGMEIKAHSIRQEIDRKSIEIFYVPPVNQVAGIKNKFFIVSTKKFN